MKGSSNHGNKRAKMFINFAAGAWSGLESTTTRGTHLIGKSEGLKLKYIIIKYNSP